jgi:arginyl-tRNA synthetase
MIQAQSMLRDLTEKALQELFQLSGPEPVFQKTRKEFEGDFTLVTFPYVKPARKSPDAVATAIGEYLAAHSKYVSGFNVVKGFLNIALHDAYWLEFLTHAGAMPHFGIKEEGTSGRTIMLEYSSPNTNKPLHLGHVRNNLLGYSVATILKANGHKVIKANLVNDRGIHICKSMLAWQKFGAGETPSSSNMKGDHLVGKYYVAFDKAYKSEVKQLIEKGLTEEEAKKQAPLMLEAQEMLRKWEAGDAAVRELWKTMNGWVYEGFSITYRHLGVNFDVMYYESNTYLLGKELVQEGLKKGVFYKKENGSIAIDLTAEGLDEKIVLRSDGTSVYITQDLGTAIERFREFKELNQLIYTVGNEQDFHFKVLFSILSKLGYSWATECYHLSYGMVELPEGKMKSREGTVVDADDLLAEMQATAEATTKELGKVDGFNAEELEKLYQLIGLGALKYFILKVDPRKKMLFDPKESIDFNGHTGPFIQYTHARIKSVMRRAGTLQDTIDPTALSHAAERDLLRCIYEFPAVVEIAGATYNPADIANYVYELAKYYNRFYHECPIMKEERADVQRLRLAISELSARVIAEAMLLLGIEVPEKM